MRMAVQFHPAISPTSVPARVLPLGFSLRQVIADPRDCREAENENEDDGHGDRPDRPLLHPPECHHRRDNHRSENRDPAPDRHRFGAPSRTPAHHRPGLLPPPDDAREAEADNREDRDNREL